MADELRNINDRTIGSGAIYPITLVDGSWGISRGDPDLIINNIRSILLYQIGFRIRQEIFGTRNYECLEEPNVGVTRLLVYRFTKEALENWEPRITLKDIKVTFTKTDITISLVYTINSTKTVEQLDFNYQKN